MKTGTLDKMKFMVFQNIIKAPRYAAIGLLEGLWYMTATSAPSGDIGRFSDLEIAAWLGWPDQASDLITAYVTAGFIDRCSVNRLVVHDWDEHCPNHVANNLKRWNKDFVQPSVNAKPSQDGTNSTCGVQAGVQQSPGAPEPPKEPPKDDPIGDSFRTILPNLTKPNQTQSIPTEPIQTKPLSPDGDDGVRFPEFFEQFWNAYPKRGGKRRGKRKAFNIWKTIPAADRNLVIKAATNYQSEEYIRDPERFLSADWWRDWVEPPDSAPDVPLVVGPDFDYLSHIASVEGHQ